MTAVEHLNRLDDLIVEHTKAPVSATLRNQLSTAREQVEALEAGYAKLKNDFAVLKNTTEVEIAGLKEENAKLRPEKDVKRPSLSEEEAAILKVLESDGAEWTPDTVAKKLGTDKYRTHYLLTNLRMKELVQEILADRFRIRDWGRKAIHER